MAIDDSPTVDMWSGIYESKSLNIRVMFRDGTPGMYIHRKCCGYAPPNKYTTFGDLPWGSHPPLPGHLEVLLGEEYRRYIIKEAA